MSKPDVHTVIRVRIDGWPGTWTRVSPRPSASPSASTSFPTGSSTATTATYSMAMRCQSIPAANASTDTWCMGRREDRVLPAGRPGLVQPQSDVHELPADHTFLRGAYGRAAQPQADPVSREREQLHHFEHPGRAAVRSCDSSPCRAARSKRLSRFWSRSPGNRSSKSDSADRLTHPPARASCRSFSSTSRTFSVRAAGVNGFCRNATSL